VAEADRVIDIAFAIDGGQLPAEHARALADALERALPWASDTPILGVHPLKLARGGGQALLSGRTRLTLRVPRERADEVADLAGAELPLPGGRLRLGAAQARELLPWGTLYAHCVSAGDSADELTFLQAAQAELEALGVRGRVICGLARRGADGTVEGYGVMVDQLSATDSVTLQCHGLGAGRRVGLGVFVPHKSAAAVGAAP
jgi:CRISPR-associated protein Cas6